MRIAEERAKREGWKVVERYADYGISGASMMRPGIQKLMLDATAKKFDVVIAEALDRLSRDQEDVAGIYKRLHFAGVKILTLSEGEVNEMHIGLKGTMNALFLKDLAAKTKRGLRGKVEHGLSGGGNSYGYDVVKKFDDKGEPIKGERTINEQQAFIINRVFEEYAVGKSPKAIAKQLNKESIPSPSGKTWSQSTINGNKRRGNGLLNNELYIGRLVWNRQRFLKDPQTGKRVARPNDPSEWIFTDVPEMRIIQQDLWDKVKERQTRLENRRSLCKKQRPKLLLSGLLECGCCGGGFVKVSKKHYGCFSAREKSVCTNLQTIRQDYLEQAVLDALQNHLMDPVLTDFFCEEYAKCLTDMHRRHNDSIAHHRHELKKCQKEDAKMVQAICDGFASPQLKEKMNANTAHMEELERLLGNKEEVPSLLQPSMARHFRVEVKNLIAKLDDVEGRDEAADIIRTLVDKIVLTPKIGVLGLNIDMHGNLAGILTIAAGNKSKLEKHEIIEQVMSVANGCNRHMQDVMVAEARSVRVLPVQDKLVAGERNPQVLPTKQEVLVAGVGFEPTTFRL